MANADIPAAKRLGLPVDLDRLRTEGDAWLTAADRYALKTHGVCPQAQPGVFMVRVRVPGGVLLTAQARGLARLARRFAADWLHLTTRQSIELHWVDAAAVGGLLGELERLGLGARSTCGHTLRNVVCSEDAGLGLDEPFDCLPDARRISDTLVARSAELNVVLPSRVNVCLGGTPRSREDALLNDIGLVSRSVDGQPGYELWVGGSLGRSPRLATKIDDFVSRDDVLAAVEAVIELFVEHGDLGHPARGRLKFVVDQLGAEQVRAEWRRRFATLRMLPRPPAPAVSSTAPADRVAVLAHRPPGGWSQGVRPQQTPGLGLVTIDVPLGDTCGSELELLADLADRHADGALQLTRDQDVTLRNVPLASIGDVRRAVTSRGLHLAGEVGTAAVRACTGASVCAIGITESPIAGRMVATLDALRRNPSLRVHVSGCPNSCAQHQAADVGAAGSKVRIAGRTTDGYHVFVGADLAEGLVGEPVGRVATTDLPDAVAAVVGLWEATRHPGEQLGRCARRLGLDAVAAHLETVLAQRWATGAEPDLLTTAAPLAAI